MRHVVMLTQRGEVLCSQDDDLLDNCVFRKMLKNKTKQTNSIYCS